MPPGGEDGRRPHYERFYDVDAAEESVIVVGNCQAESLRIVLGGDDLPTMRIPPVHELTESDLPFLETALRRAPLIVTQPIRDDYRGLPIGTAQLRSRVTASTTVVVVPAIRHRSLYPTQLVVRIPDRAVADPPIVAYHDARTLIEALGSPRPVLRPAQIRSIARNSTAELATREERHGAVRISDVFASPRFPMLRTINHPGNPVWLELARRVRREVGLADTVTDPGRELLSSVIAPREDVVIETWGLDAEPDPHWQVDGRRVHDDEVRAAHLEWFADNPEGMRLAAERHAAAITELMSA